MNGPLVSVVLGSYNRRAFLKSTLESVRNNGTSFPYEIIVVDGGSTDGSLRYLAKQKDVITIIQHNRGVFRGKPVERRSWGYFINLGFKAAQGKFILMISDDCLLIPGAIKNGVEQFEKKLAEGEKVGAVAFYWRNWPEQKDYWVGLTLGNKMFVNHGLYLRQGLEKVGWIDEQTYQFYHADGDLCLKLWQVGYQVIDCKTAFVEHCDHIKPSRISNAKDWDAYLKKWEGIFYDPQKNNTGGWIYQHYIDQNRTYRQFPFSVRLKSALRKIRDVIK
ncbi:MAG: glycosyltransferase [Dehalococcoidales bacterium]|jgi:glycosyltransferase involved in cell wall biosynthesis